MVNFVLIRGKLEADATKTRQFERVEFRFPIVSEEEYKTKSSDQWRKLIDHHDVIHRVWNDKVEEYLEKNLVKGNTVIIKGKLRNVKYNCKNTGEEKRFTFVDSKELQIDIKQKENNKETVRVEDVQEPNLLL